MDSVNRLFSEFAPDTYDLSLTIDRVGRRFEGTTVMHGFSTSGAIAFHARDLQIESVTVDGKKADFSLKENDEVWVTGDRIHQGDHVVAVGFSGKITDTLHGLYFSRFEHRGVKKELLVTQFESHYAREMFPCVDEPEAKATFAVTVTTEPNIAVLGNMPVKQSSEQNGRLVTTFETTPRMSTYLVALVMGELQSISAKTASGVEVAAWSTPVHASSHLQYALDHAVKTIEFFDEYFGTPYPLPKADHVAIPDFDAGAMENWGLITYRESALLTDPEKSSLPSRQYVASVVAHELSHQWFGNLVTMKWWNNLWLNESFASIMEVIAPQALHPGWNLWLDFSTHDGVVSMRRDAIDGVQAVQTNVNHPDEISSLFDGAIVYAKGARLMRMMQQLVGDEAFRAALKQYFKKFAYKNTDENDLWQCLSDTSGKDIGALMNTWISTSGFPVVHARVEKGNLQLRQERFFVGPHRDDSQIWPIPLDSNIKDAPALFETETLTVPLATDDYVQLNKTDSAHFLTNYDDELFARLLAAVKNNQLDEIGRLKLIHERVMLTRAGIANPSTLVDLLSAFHDESSEAVWDMLSIAVGELKKYVLDDETAEHALKKLVGRLSKSQFERLGWDARKNESVNDVKLRPRMLGNMVYAEDESVIQKASTIATESSIEATSADQRSIILGAHVRYGKDPAFVDSLVDRYSKETSPELKDDIRSALTSTKDVDFIDRLLAKLTDTEVIRPQDTMYWFVYLLSNRDGRTLTWRWLRDNWEWVEKTFGDDKSFDAYPRYAGQILMTRAELAEYKDFFGPKTSDIALKRAIEMGITDLEGRVELIEKFKGDVTSRLRNL